MDEAGCRVERRLQRDRLRFPHRRMHGGVACRWPPSARMRAAGRRRLVFRQAKLASDVLKWEIPLSVMVAPSDRVSTVAAEPADAGWDCVIACAVVVP